MKFYTIDSARADIHPGREPRISNRQRPQLLRFRLTIAIPLILFCLSIASGWGAIVFFDLTGQPLIADQSKTLLAWIVILAIGLINMLMGVAIAVGITTPLRKVTALAERLSPHDSRALPDHDEVGSLVSAFHRMMLSLDHYISDSYILKNLPVGVMTIDDRGHVLTLNDVAKSLLKLHGEAEDNSRNNADLQLTSLLPMTTENRDARQAITCALAGEDVGSHSMEATLTGLSGSHIRVLLEIRPFRRTATNERNQAMVSFKNLQEREQVRAEIRRIDQLATLGSLAAGLAHEFRNPLGSIRGLVELLQEDMPGTDNRRRYLETILQSTDRMDKMIAELLTMTRSEPEATKSIDVSVLLKEIIMSMAAEADKKAVRIIQQYHPALHPIHTRPSIVRHTLSNVIRNAVEATPPDGRVTIEASDHHGDAVSTVVIRVTNTGSYIPPEERERIFHPFVTGKFGGTGLGLFLAQHLLESLGGTIHVESAKEQGTTFEVHLASAE